ncbi:tetratricopeptide repeat protein [Allorhodopirellula solitaria]|nr:hypothetical protein [Allorhodopirellula solitaria]
MKTSRRQSMLCPLFGPGQFSCRLLGWFVTAVVLLAASDVHAQRPADKPLRLSSDTVGDSQLSAVRDDLVAAITEGASPADTTALIQRQRRFDRELAGELAAIRDELVEIQKGEFDRESQQRREELRRQQSLLWLTRVELAALLSEMFAEGSADGVALSATSIRLIREALANFPNDSELHQELARLLSESQLRSGDPDSAIRTMQQASTAGKGTEDAVPTEQKPQPLVVNTSSELAFVIRVDLAKHRWDAAADKLQQYYGDAPSSAPRSPAMDLARLRYLMLRPNRATDLREVAQWLDAIEQRGGATSRRNAETLLARYRASRGADESESTDASDSGERSTDPRVLRADARYYLRVGQSLPAAVTFARAAVRDRNAPRSIQSAIESAAILQSVSKEPAAAELLRRIAMAHPQHESSPMLVLQAASLRSAAGGTASSSAGQGAHELLTELIDQWPLSQAAQTARATLIESAVARGDAARAAELATEMPAAHWNDTTARRCVDLWQRAIVGASPLSSLCDWDDDECQSENAAGVVESLTRMRNVFAAAASTALAEQAEFTCTILLDSCDNDARRERLRLAGEGSSDPFLSELARRRLGKSVPDVTSEKNAPRSSVLVRVVAWRLNEDLSENPALHRDIASYLLTLLPDFSSGIDSRLPIAWSMWSGNASHGLQRLRDEIPESDQPGELIAAAASALADSANPSDLQLASRLWLELAAGLPSATTSHQRAKVEGIACQWRAGDRSGARAAAELMLLTNPPQDPAMREKLQKWSR